MESKVEEQRVDDVDGGYPATFSGMTLCLLGDDGQVQRSMGINRVSGRGVERETMINAVDFQLEGFLLSSVADRTSEESCTSIYATLDHSPTLAKLRP